MKVQPKPGQGDPLHSGTVLGRRGGAAAGRHRWAAGRHSGGRWGGGAVGGGAARRCLFGAIVGCAKDDIKKALAGSTMSQIT
ncbi:hypothetical protein, partial [Streptomyces sp. NPDC005345]|uniref:hypothetical protein n=1 Tax=Streptomyces sp. NPDC005345 TaxID=3156877 RepID=UPI0033A50D15